MPGESVPQGLWLPPRVATLFVAASDALDRSRAQADFLCDGVADDVQINLALNALPAGVQGRVVLSEGTFNIVNPIVIPANNTTLRGQGRSTFINGDGLATGEHGIVLSGVTNCTVKKLAIQTQDGGGKACHCVFIEDGANSFEVEYVTIVDSDSDGIHVEGTNILDGGIHNCHVDNADGYGIMVSMDNGNSMLRLHVFDNFITGAGSAGIALWNGVGVGNTSYCDVSDNVVYVNGNEGIIVWDSDYSVVTGNVVVGNTQWGVRVRESEHVNLSNNLCYLNGADGILLEESTECLAEGNVCIGSTAATSDGIQVGGARNSIIGNHCCENGRHGINVVATGSQANITGNYCYENDQHGISMADVEVKVSGNYCYHNSQGGAGTYHGINLAGGADRCQVNDNFCNDDGAAQEDGIHLEDGATDCQIVGNYCYNGMGSGIALMANNDNCLIKDNYCSLNDDYGIEIAAVTCDGNTVENNKLVGNINGQILDSGTDTVLPCIFVPVPNPSSSIGTHPAELLTDGVDVMSRFEFYIPSSFTELVRAQVMIVPGGAGNLRRTFTANWGKACTAENYNEHTDTIAAGQVAVTINDINCIDVSGALDLIAAGDLVGMTFTREASDALDTVDANCYLLGLRLQYV